MAWCLLLFQRTRAWFLAPVLGSSQLHLQRVLMPLAVSGSCSYVRTHTHFQKIKKYKKSEDVKGDDLYIALLSTSQEYIP